MPSIFGIPDSKLVQDEQSSMGSALIEWGNETIEKLKASLDEKVSDGTRGDLRQSLIVLPLKVQDQSWSMEFQAEDYWKFINKGVQGLGGTNESKGIAYQNKGGGSPFSFKEGNKPSARHFESWSNAKGLNMYAVRESVFRQGIRPTHFFDDVITPEWTAELVKRMEQAGAREIEISISGDFKATIK